MIVLRFRAGVGLLGATLFVLPIAAAEPAIPPWGFDLDGMDRSVLLATISTATAMAAGSRRRRFRRIEACGDPSRCYAARPRATLRPSSTTSQGGHNPAGSVERKIADTYNAYLDTQAIEAAGLAPVAADLAKIAAARSHQDVTRLMGHPELGVGGPLSITPWPDAANPDRYAINIVQSGLSLPDRDFI